jgi:UTP--glucose-1-phosphate uridylyltransferase
MTEPLYTPLQEALELAVVPSITIQCCEQPQPEGLGDAILQAEALVSNESFAVLLPDDIVRERIGRTVYPRELRRMMESFRHLEHPHLVAVTPVSKSKRAHCGVAKLAAKEVMPRIRPMMQLIEKPSAKHPISRSPRAMGIVGRYLLQPSIFPALHKLRDKKKLPLHLTDALEQLRQAGEHIYAFELEAKREDVGEILGQAGELIGDS